MKEIKTFFAEDNRLNKGYAEFSMKKKPENNYYRKKFEHILPPLEVINEYENYYPGTLSKLIEMAEKEQQHRQSIDLLNQNIYERANRTGQFFALLSILLICFTTIILVYSGNIISSMVFPFIAFSTIILISGIPNKFLRKNINGNIEKHIEHPHSNKRRRK